MNRFDIGMIIRLAAGILAVVLIIWIGWPILLAAALWVLYQYYRAKRQLKKAEKEMEQQYYGTAQTEYREPEGIPEGTGEVIDVEFTVKNRDKEEAMHG